MFRCTAFGIHFVTFIVAFAGHVLGHHVRIDRPRRAFAANIERLDLKLEEMPITLLGLGFMAVVALVVRHVARA